MHPASPTTADVRTMRRSPLLLSAFVATTFVASACEEPRAWGEWNSIIAGVSNERWSEIQDVVYSALEPRIFTVRAEKMFRVTQQDPREEDWNQLQRFRQLLVIGSADEPWVAQALAKLDQDTFDPPELLQVENVWAKGQRVSIILLSPSGGAEEVTTLLEPLFEVLDGQYRQWVLERMFMTRPDTALADSLVTEAGFELLVPEVYYLRRDRSVYVFRNDNPDPAELIRQVTVSWRDTDLSEIGEQDIIAWREEVQASHFSYPQVVDPTAKRPVRPGLQPASPGTKRGGRRRLPDTPGKSAGNKIRGRSVLPDCRKSTKREKVLRSRRQFPEIRS